MSDAKVGKALVGRVERVSLTDEDNVEVRDAIGTVLVMAPGAARRLHSELGKFLARSNDAKPLPVPTRGDFNNLKKRVELLELKVRGNDE